MSSFITPEQYNSRLAHYNAWLRDPNREFASIYPGYPGDAKPKKVRPVVVESAPSRKRSGPTKQQRAIELYKANKGLANPKLVELFMKELDMSKAGATTYLYNAKKLG